MGIAAQQTIRIRLIAQNPSKRLHGLTSDLFPMDEKQDTAGLVLADRKGARIRFSGSHKSDINSQNKRQFLSTA